MTITNNSSLYYYDGALKGRKWFDGLLSDIRPGGDATSILLDTGLHYEVSKQPLFTSGDAFSDPVMSDRHRGVWTRDLLTGQSQFADAIVGRDYTPIQNPPIVESLAELQETGYVTWGLGGQLNNGMKCFIHGVIGDEYTVNGDPHRRGIVASWSHDGSGSLRISPFVTRLWCANQIPAMFNRRVGGVSIRHTTSAHIKMETLTSSIVAALAQVDDYEKIFGRLFAKQVAVGDVDEFINRLVPIAPGLANTPEHLLTQGQKRSLTIARNKRNAIRNVYLLSETQENLRGTAAGLFHAAVEASDHYFSGERGKRVLLGTDIDFKVSALELALAA